MNMSKRAQSALRDPSIPSALRAIVVYAAQNPGLEYGNYASGWNDKSGRAAYFSESRRITRDWHRVRAAARMCENMQVTDADIMSACERAFSGRLKVNARPNNVYAVDYCTGQYWPTEYRLASAVVLELAAEYAFLRLKTAA